MPIYNAVNETKNTTCICILDKEQSHQLMNTSPPPPPHPYKILINI